uniref:RING-type domain-containing protein n=1 Tax=Xiphophorus couchianus TaxID=32473 RepID=A0A3B5MGY2_9TELE
MIQNPESSESQCDSPLAGEAGAAAQMDAMAAATISVDQDEFCCPVCLEVLRDPVTIPCGHSYCLDCIEDYWNTAKQKDQYSCPQCRQVFNPKPLLSRNTVLAEVVEKFLKSEVQSAAQHLAKPEEVKCSVCKGRKNRAVESCPQCLESFCLAHLKGHEERFHRKGHNSVNNLEASPLKNNYSSNNQHSETPNLYKVKILINFLNT